MSDRDATPGSPASADLTALVADTYARLADELEGRDPADWDAPSLCEGWRVREVIAHVTMAARMSTEEFFAGMAEAGGDFQAFSDAVAARDAGLPIEEHVTNLRSPQLAAWEPPGGGAIGALNHVVVHSLDIAHPLDLAAANDVQGASRRICSDDAARAILDGLAGGGMAGFFGVELSGLRLEATDADWSWGDGDRLVSAPVRQLISLLAGRTLPDGSHLR